MDILKLWEDLGLALGIKVSELEVIGSDKPDAKAKMKAMLLAWLRGRGKESSWNTLCDALRNPLVDRKDIAAKIEASRS